MSELSREYLLGWTDARREISELILKKIKERENKSHIGTLTRIYSFCNKFVKSQQSETESK